MMSFLKQKRSSADAKSSTKSPNITESDSRTQKNASSAPSSKAGAVHSPPPASAGGGGGAAPNSKPNSKPRDFLQKASPETWIKTDCPIESRIMAATVQNNTLSMSRSGRLKAKGKARARLFSEDTDAVPHDGHPNQSARGSSSLATPEDRQTVLEAMAKRTGATTSSRNPTTTAGGNPSKPESGASKKSSDRETSEKWSTTTHSTDL